jgi:hypothetical protein
MVNFTRFISNPMFQLQPKAAPEDVVIEAPAPADVVIETPAPAPAPDIEAPEKPFIKKARKVAQKVSSE